MNIKDLKRKELAQKIRDFKTEDFLNLLKENNITRAFVVYENGEFILSHPNILKPLQAFLELSQDFSKHEGIFIGREDGIDSLFFAFVHDTRRGLAQGGLRFASYEKMSDVVIDGLRLSQGMSRKNALAGLWWGGGKGIMVLPAGIKTADEITVGSEERRKYFEAYGRFIASLKGVYYTAEDIGTNTDDMKAILSQNRFITCIPPTSGGSGNPSPFTARGVFRAMQAAWKTISGTDDLKDVKVSVQGAGNVGSSLIRYLYEADAEIWFCDTSETRIKNMLLEMPKLKVVSNDEIFDLDVDVFAPCAIGAQVNSRTIPRLKVKLVCGAANNILKEPETDSISLKEKGILFVPDFLCNRMGIVNCADEWLGYLEDDIRLASERVYPDTLRVFKYSKNRAVTTTKAAIDLADIAASELHPLLSHRGRRISDEVIKSLKGKVKNFKKLEPAFSPSLDENEIRLGWERNNFFDGDDLLIASSPISCSSPPDLSSFVTPLFADIRARHLKIKEYKNTKIIAGANHGGLSLQIAIEENIPYERHETGKARFFEISDDRFNKNHEEVRNQLHISGIGFAQNNWTNPMSEKGKTTVNDLYEFLKASNLVKKEKRLFNYCPDSKSIVVSSDTKRGEILVEEKYQLLFKTDENKTIETHMLFPEYSLGAVALAINTNGKYKEIKSKSIFNFFSNKTLPIIFTDEIKTDAELIVPIHSYEDEVLAKKYGMTEVIEIFDESANVFYDQKLFSREDIRKYFVTKFANNVFSQKGSFKADVLRRKNSETLLIAKRAEEFFVKIDEGKEKFLELIEKNKIKFNSPKYKEKVIDFLNKTETWCISRDYWWGNKIENSDKVFSTWFSMVATTLQSVGWNDNPKGNTIDEVFTDSDFLLRWIIPAQIISLMVLGKPAFLNVFVYEPLTILERKLVKIEGSEDSQNDEERFIFRTTKKQMNRRLGNSIEPKTLIKRFGADVLRLSYILSLNEDFEIVLSQDKINKAHKELYGFVDKITNIVSLIKKSGLANNSTLYEQDIIDIFEEILVEANNNYLVNDFRANAELLIKSMFIFKNYVNKIPTLILENDLKDSVNTLKKIIEIMNNAFNPLVPYHFEKITFWVKKQLEL